jgi:hypothetical protein
VTTAVAQNAAYAVLPSLKTATETSVALKGLLSVERLAELAEAGYLPCWRLDGGEPMFEVAAVRRYIAEHLMVEQTPRPWPRTITVVAEPASRLADPPPALAFLDVRALPLATYPPAVYFLCLGDSVVYVGQTSEPVARIASHLKYLGGQFDRVFYLPVPRSELRAVEHAFIRALSPELNGNGGEREWPTDAPTLAKYQQEGSR